MSYWNAAVYKSCKLPLQIFNMIGQILLQFSKFLLYIHFLYLVELERWLTGVAFFPSSTRTDGSIPALKTFPGKVIPSCDQKSLGSGLSDSLGMIIEGLSHQ